MKIESKHVNLSHNDELFQSFYAIVSFDGGTYRATINCSIDDEELARKMQCNKSGSFRIKAGDISYLFTGGVRENYSIRFTELELERTSVESIKKEIELIEEAVNTYVNQKHRELLIDIHNFNEIFDVNDD